MQGLTPLEVAHLQNQKLRVAYQNRVAQMSRKNYNTTAMVNQLMCRNNTNLTPWSIRDAENFLFLVYFSNLFYEFLS